MAGRIVSASRARVASRVALVSLVLLCLCASSAWGAVGDLARARALWLAAGTIAWPGMSARGRYRLYYAADGGMEVGSDGVRGADGYFALSARAKLPAALSLRYPHLAGAVSLALPQPAAEAVATLLKGQLVVVAFSNATPINATQLQIQGVLDQRYAAAAAPQTLGVSFGAVGVPTFRVWAPTARSVRLNVGDAAWPMSVDPASGVWSYVGDRAWTNSAYYTYTVEVWSRTDGGKVRRYTVTDPYAASADADVYGPGRPPQRSMVADLASVALTPPGWATQPAPAPGAAADFVLYELHVRDFSANDASVAALNRGKFSAFTDTGSQGMRHLARLAAAGVTHVHLLPVFDFASVNEGGCSTPTIENSDALAAVPQALVAADKDADCYNWGYDPRHYGLPDGSYASSAADGAVRVREFRSLVASLHAIGLGVVMDVVYNHTASPFLEQIVPGYYYRRDLDGAITTASCCPDTAPETAMMEKLMIDTLVRWAVDYRVDGFRFDLMGFIPKASMQKAQAAVRSAIGPGRSTYFYGEGWNFGPIANDRQFVQARQANLAGTGIGSFNDRMRDALRGGGPTDSGASLVAHQGFINGQCYDPNSGDACSAAERALLKQRHAWLRLGLAGNLATFRVNGVAGAAIDYGGQPAGYAASPEETINYAGAHDNETLYDISQYKHPAVTTAAERSRAQVVALGAVLLAQGVPLLHAGDELLRSKGFDANSYDSGDWFNRIDWSARTNYLDSFGLPPASANRRNWATMTPFLRNPSIVPAAADIASARDAVLDLLALRRSTTKFRLRSAPEVLRCVSFPDAAAPRDGLVVMRIGADGVDCGDATFRTIVVLINADRIGQSYAVAALAGRSFVLHPLQAAGADPVVRSAHFDATAGRFGVPARTVAVFVER